MTNITKRNPNTFASFFPRTALEEIFPDNNIRSFMWNDLPLFNSKAGTGLKVNEDENNYYFSVELPGINKDNINVSLKDNVLEIDARADEENNDSVNQIASHYENHIRYDLNYYDNIDLDNISSKFENGVLTVSASKKEPEKNENERKQIQIEKNNHFS